MLIYRFNRVLAATINNSSVSSPDPVGAIVYLGPQRRRVRRVQSGGICGTTRGPGLYLGDRVYGAHSGSKAPPPGKGRWFTLRHCLSSAAVTALPGTIKWWLVSGWAFAWPSPSSPHHQATTMVSIIDAIRLPQDSVRPANIAGGVLLVRQQRMVFRLSNFWVDWGVDSLSMTCLFVRPGACFTGSPPAIPAKTGRHAPRSLTSPLPRNAPQLTARPTLADLRQLKEEGR